MVTYKDLRVLLCCWSQGQRNASSNKAVDARSSTSASYECWRLERIDFLRALTTLTKRQSEVCRKTLLLRLLMLSEDPFLNSSQVWCMFVRASLYEYMRREENHLVATKWFITLIICSTYFGHLYVHHQEFKTILVLLPRMVCNALVAGGWRSGAGQQVMRPGWGKLLKHSLLPCTWPPTASNQGIAHHTR